jgi:hypothetical protein
MTNSPSAEQVTSPTFRPSRSVKTQTFRGPGAGVTITSIWASPDHTIISHCEKAGDLERRFSAATPGFLEPDKVANLEDARHVSFLLICRFMGAFQNRAAKDRRPCRAAVE